MFSWNNFPLVPETATLHTAWLYGKNTLGVLALPLPPLVLLPLFTGGRKLPRSTTDCQKAAYFQGCNTPGLEEFGFKSLFIHNLHESIHCQVEMYCQTRNLSMLDIKRQDARVLGIQTSKEANLSLKGNERSRAKFVSRVGPQGQPPHQ